MRITETLEDMERAASRVSYDPETGEFSWRPGTRRFGKPCGSDHDGYLRISVTFGGVISAVMAHRLAWFIVYGVLAPTEIDHKDQIKSNNRILNLRPVSRSINMRNSTMRSDNTSGITGVTFEKKSGAWRARAMIDGESNDLGLFDDKEAAGFAITAFRRQNGFTDQHGRIRPDHA